MLLCFIKRTATVLGWVDGREEGQVYSSDMENTDWEQTISGKSE